MAGRLEGKVCVITGAASGIGAETARLFAEQGARVVGIDLDRENAEGETTIEADVSDEAQVAEAYKWIGGELGRIDVLMNNAGINPTDDSSVLDTDCKAHELDNLYVVDTSFFPSIGAVNPALTAMANALRVGDHLLERLG